MRRRIAAATAACCVLAGLAFVAQSQSAPNAVELPHAAPPSADQPSTTDIELETVLVIGEQPGPGLWKVTKGDHVLWILASHDPLQARMTWRTTQVEARIAESKEVLYPPNIEIEPSVGFFKMLSLIPAIPAALKVGKNPDGAGLDDIVPPAAYARWLELRDKYWVKFGKKAKVDDAEQWRPSVAIQMLQSWADTKSGLSRGRVHGFVQRTATKHKVPIRRLPAIKRAVKVEDNIRAMLKEAAVVPQAEITCFEQALDKLEPALELAKQRANAWARGDIAKLRELHRDNRPSDYCFYTTALALTANGSKNSANARKMLDSFIWHEEQAYAQSQRDWLAAAQKVLDKNQSTFSVLPVGDLTRAGGFVDKLRALGYTVEEPL
jgi:hypothetical protein